LKLLILVNDASDLGPRQTTTMLIRAAARRHETWVAGIAGCLGETWHGRRVDPSDDLAAIREQIAGAPREPLDPASLDGILIRTNPARDREHATSHESGLDALRRIRERGVPVVNDPDALERFSDKISLLELPGDWIPRTASIRSESDARPDWSGPIVVKPAAGTRGEAVSRFESLGEPGVEDAIRAILPRTALIQEFVPEAVDGDTRVVVLDGVILEVDGAPAAIRRIPAEGDFRSNLHAGGAAAPAEITDGMRSAVAEVGPWLAERGIRLVGFDFVGDRILELNVFSTGGLFDAERFGEVDFCVPILGKLFPGLSDQGRA
jgi:glutathione synthase